MALLIALTHTCSSFVDIIIIVSGRAAKGVMLYITNYSTKSDLKTHDMLLLLSHTVANLDNSTNNERPLSHMRKEPVLFSQNTPFPHT